MSDATSGNATTTTAASAAQADASPEPYEVVDEMFNVIRFSVGSIHAPMASSAIVATARERKQSIATGQIAAYVVSSPLNFCYTVICLCPSRR